ATYSATRLKTDDGFCRQALIRTGNRRTLPVGGFALAAVTVERSTKSQHPTAPAPSRTATE
ncbi:hypothetical protein, partial [uncultured Lacticaseibacillus sp.]|uniref:hypothetical protein n=1 Tax=uncultured Lacticaseibacillus sp. TaxID=2775882 RepID=UPI002599489C